MPKMTAAQQRLSVSLKTGWIEWDLSGYYYLSPGFRRGRIRTSLYEAMLDNCDVRVLRVRSITTDGKAGKFIKTVLIYKGNEKILEGSFTVLEDLTQRYLDGRATHLAQLKVHNEKLGRK